MFGLLLPGDKAAGVYEWRGRYQGLDWTGRDWLSWGPPYAVGLVGYQERWELGRGDSKTVRQQDSR